MEAPRYLNLPPGKVLKLVKCLYGLKQSGREWNLLLSGFLKEIGFVPCKSDSCVFFQNLDSELMAILVLYVDDLILATKTQQRLYEIEKLIMDRFASTEGELNLYLGIKVDQNREKQEITLSQKQYAIKVVKEFLPDSAPTKETPMPSTTRLSKSMEPNTEAEIAVMQGIPYRNATGSLMYLANATRPDILFPTNNCARYMSNPGFGHWSSIQEILQYLKLYPNIGIKFKPTFGKKHVLICFVDSDHAADVDTRRSTSGYLCFLNNGVVSWNTKVQKTVAKSSAEAEYMALFEATSETIWLRSLLKELGFPQEEATEIFIDNSAAIDITFNPTHHGRTKHIDVDFHFIRERKQSGEIIPKKVHTSVNDADIMTKATVKRIHQGAVRRFMCNLDEETV
jgi:hypothetical protein